MATHYQRQNCIILHILHSLHKCLTFYHFLRYHLSSQHHQQYLLPSSWHQEQSAGKKLFTSKHSCGILNFIHSENLTSSNWPIICALWTKLSFLIEHIWQISVIPISTISTSSPIIWHQLLPSIQWGLQVFCTLWLWTTFSKEKDEVFWGQLPCPYATTTN